jgi:hypothetical protein
MSAIFSEIELQWQGESHSVTPTMRLINKIENDVSLAKLVVRIQSGEMPMSHIATVYTHLLNYAGVKASVDDVYVAIVMGGDEFIHHAVSVAMGCFFPKSQTTDDVKKKPTEQ